MSILIHWKSALILGLFGLASFVVLGISAAMVAGIYADAQIVVSQAMVQRANYESIAAKDKAERAKYLVSYFKHDELTGQLGCPVDRPLYAIVQGVKVRVC